MLTHPTLEQMNALGLTGITTAYRELLDQARGNDLSFDERLRRPVALRRAHMFKPLLICTLDDGNQSAS